MRYEDAIDFVRSAVPDAIAVYVFGSRARGDTHQASDVDLVGFRNVAVHDYTRLDLAIVRAIIESHLDDLLRLASSALRIGEPAARG